MSTIIRIAEQINHNSSLSEYFHIEINDKKVKKSCHRPQTSYTKQSNLRSDDTIVCIASALFLICLSTYRVSDIVTVAVRNKYLILI